MPTVRKLTGRSAIDLGFRRTITPPPVQPRPMEAITETEGEQPTPVVVMPPARKRIHKIDAVPAAQTQQKKLRVAYYCRTSTAEEIQKTSIEGQRTHFEKLIAAHDDWALVDGYIEDGVTGTKAEVRPELQRLLRDCRDGKIDTGKATQGRTRSSGRAHTGKSFPC